MTDNYSTPNAHLTESNSMLGGLRAEIHFLLRCSRVQMTREDVETCKSLSTGPQFDWNYTLGQAWRQKVLPLVGRNIDVYGIAGSEAWPFLMTYLANRTRTIALIHELDRILAYLDSINIPVIVRKGAVLLSLVYGDFGLRRINDIDFLVQDHDVNRLKEALIDFGYAQQRVTTNRRRLEPFSRRLELVWQMQVDNLVPFTRIAGDPYVRYFTIDIVRHLFQPQSPFSIPTDDLFVRKRPFRLSIGNAWRLSSEDFLIDLCAHLHKEATLLVHIEKGTDLQLIKFCDIAEFVSRSSDPIDPDKFVALVEENGLQIPVYFALYLTRILYPESIPASLVNAFEPTSGNLTFLDEFGQIEGQPGVWEQNFVDRLFDWDRRLRVTQRSRLPNR